MNILMLASYFPPNPFCGIGIHVYKISKEFIKVGYSVTVVVIWCHTALKNVVLNSKIEGVNVINFEEDNEKIEELNQITLIEQEEWLNYISCSSFFVKNYSQKFKLFTHKCIINE